MADPGPERLPGPKTRGGTATDILALTPSYYYRTRTALSSREGLTDASFSRPEKRLMILTSVQARWRRVARSWERAPEAGAYQRGSRAAVRGRHAAKVPNRERPCLSACSPRAVTKLVTHTEATLQEHPKSSLSVRAWRSAVCAITSCPRIPDRGYHGFSTIRAIRMTRALQSTSQGAGRMHCMRLTYSNSTDPNEAPSHGRPTFPSLSERGVFESNCSDPGSVVGNSSGPA